MDIISNTTEFNITTPTAVAIGKFDGVHIGHRCILDELLRKKAEGLKTCVFTFDPLPALFFAPGSIKEITSLKEKREIFAEMGVDILVEYPLNTQSASISPFNFVTEVLKGQMNAAFIVAGTDLSFGDKGMGDVKLLRELAEPLEIELSIMDKICVDGEEVSSSRIRRLLYEGNVREANRLLVNPFSMEGKVEQGAKIGRTLGFPTLNIHPDPDKLIPKCGVYAALVNLNGRTYRSVTNVGFKPTVHNTDHPVVESFLYDFDQNVYGRDVTVKLLEFIRPEVKFNDLTELKNQIKKDVKMGNAIDYDI
ncbi:MAG: bifunctional riboflavin kinase/FAD synthetase [Lachnospiraceae bacterium]|nr:bifunctional riboflavin kinase/FAD synthetase [Lachnospiraceae bacterium]